MGKKYCSLLDILAISIDSIVEQTNLESGRHYKQQTVELQKIKQIANACRQTDVMLKINTVVSQFNYQETLTNFINELKPFRWKILQVTRVEGQNDDQFDLVKINPENFEAFCKRNKQEILPDIKVVEESEEIIQGSYLMIDQLGRFFDSNSKTHNYSQPIIKVGVHEALKQISVDTIKFEQREGNYTVISNKQAI